MQLGAGVIGAGQAPATEADRPHLEVAAVFLHQYVSRHLRGAEEAVQRLVDRHVLADSVAVGVPGCDLPALLLLDQGQSIRRVSIYLIS